MMKKRYVILFTVVVTLLIEVVLFRWWLTRDILLSWIEPGSEPSSGFVLTKDVALHDHQEQIGTLRGGQRLYHPCRHDLFLTEPFDPKVYKIYVEFGGLEDPRNYVALRSEAPTTLDMRSRLYLYSNNQGDSEQHLGQVSSEAAPSASPDEPSR